MLKKITLLASLLMAPCVYAQNTIHLSPQESKLLTNHTFWTLNATCNIQGSQSKNKIMVRVLENKGSVNGRNLTKGQSTSFTVSDHQAISVSAEPGTQVNLTNLGTTTIQALCYT